MSIGEFELIKHYFMRPELTNIQGQETHIQLGIGDDCALLTVPQGMQLAQSIDTLVEGVHFPTHCDPFLLGYRALAVNLSDLAAMGATPYNFSLALTLLAVPKQWLKSFSDGLSALAQQTNIPLIGGDTTRGPLSITIQVQGLVPTGTALRRSGAQVNDLICVTGTLGNAAGALPFVLTPEKQVHHDAGDVKKLLKHYWQPIPKLQAGQWLRDYGATSALDISDGLLGDLRHILAASKVGAVIATDVLPISSALKRCYGSTESIRLALAGGDDYELCFTIPESLAKQLPNKLPDGSLVTCIGRINDEAGIIRDAQGNLIINKAYSHF